MIKKYYFFLLINLLLFSNIVKSQNIVVIDIENLIDNNIQYLEIIKNIKKEKNIKHNLFKKNEVSLEKMLQEIETSKNILDEVELNKMINEYNSKIEDFSNLVNAYNLHYEREIVKIRKNIFQEIIVLAEIYAKNNNIDLILDSTNYLIASNNINITKVIKEKLNNINLKLEFQSFEEN